MQMYQRQSRRRWDFWDKIIIYVAGGLITFMISFIGLNINKFLENIEKLKLNQVMIVERQKNSDENIRKIEKQMDAIKGNCC